MRACVRVDNNAIGQLLDDLAVVGTPERAVAERRYLKSDLTHLGTSVPTIRKITRNWIGLNQPNLADAAAIWAHPIHEARMAAVETTIMLTPTLDPEAIIVLEGWLRQAGTWALVDPLATHVVGPLLDRHPDGTSIIERWAADDDFWIRRSALLAHLLALRNGGGDFDRFGRLADRMLDDTEFFIRKAIGWILRDSGRRRPDLVFEWLLPRADRCSGITMREAVKPLTDLQRSALRRVVDA